jgi:hypothetical protein
LKPPINLLADTVETIITQSFVRNMVHWKILTEEDKSTVEKILNYRLGLNCLHPSHTWHNLCKLSFSQLLILLGRALEEEQTEDHLKELEEFICKSTT